ncbi:hypothetical protein OEB99_06260 [Actinotalea sp. M2MS4P-6]|uniref:hypothetical protein n=1 Tax=Actinotalea sp. M2MS4P-6 TaxID=2983762 RepID=UPI0021E4F8B2|nr:hypothetical protein [Actinotalea sp. M2MS4P-6]MCV2393905.1 hypothetical protein [Actinotalea sp. M2MS4P-6]
MPDLSLAPPAVLRLAQTLAERGAPLTIRAFDSPTNQLLGATLDVGSVRVLADGGQWFVDLAPPGLDEYFDTAVWTACLNGTDVSLDLESLDSQVGWLEEHLSSGFAGDGRIECLRDARRRRAYGRMGLAT